MHPFLQVAFFLDLLRLPPGVKAMDGNDLLNGDTEQ